MIDLGLLSPLYTPIKDFIRWVVGRSKAPDPVAVLEARKKWRAEFEEHLWPLQHCPTYGDAIIRDVARMDSYPDIDEKNKGISPWFKVEVKGLYHRGFEVFLRIESVKYLGEIQGWRWAKYDEEGALNAFIVGKIPFDVVRSVEWRGDQYYYCPHIYCEFSKKHKQPYEEIILCQREKGVESDYFIEIAKYDEVRKLA